MENSIKKQVAKKAIKTEKNLVSSSYMNFEPKFIRGPTAYQTGSFRSVNSNPGQEETLEGVALKDSQNDGVAPQLSQAFESENLDLSIGRLKNQDRVLVGNHKNEEDRKVNTYKKKVVQLSRAKRLYKRKYATYSEVMDQGFCFFIPDGSPSEVFLRYLEDAAKQAETATLTEVFPFLETEMLKKQLETLLAQRASLRGKSSGLHVSEETTVKALDYQIDQVRFRIYDHQLKKIQFKKQLHRALENQSNAEIEEDSEAFWLFLWLKKLLELLEGDEDALWKAERF